MKNLIYKPFNIALILSLVCSANLLAQTQTKSYSEKFNVDEDVEVVVNTSYTDLVFETWGRDQVEVEAVIEIEGISEEEAERLFKKWSFNAVGNKQRVTVSTGDAFKLREGERVAIATTIPGHDFEFNYKVEVPDVDVILEAIPEAITIAPIPPLPPLPGNMQAFHFDYEAYKKDGEAYMKEWKKQFEKNFDKEYMKAYEEWGKEIEEFYGEDGKGRAELEKNREEMEKERQKLMAEREKMREEVRKEMEENRAETRIMMEKIREEVRRAGREAREAMRAYEFRVEPGADSKIFFYQDDGMPKNLKIKKTIRIKAPKGARLKLDVRHGEIKLAENYRDINATLVYSRLHAPLVDGKNTEIIASYSPMKVDHWKEGALKVSYSKVLELDRVQNINLSSESSNVVLKELNGNAIINGSFGDLTIEKINDSFKTLDLVLENTDAVLVLPAGAFDIYTRSTHSRVKAPESLVFKVNDLYNSKQLRGYNRSQGSGKMINIIANYSTVDLKGI